MPTINGDQSVTAVFYQVELTVTKTGEGEVTTTPYGNTEEPTFTEKYAPGETVVVKAVPEDGWFFAGWSGGAGGASATVQVTMTEDKTVHALFERIELTVQKQGQGNVTASPPGGQVSVPFTEGYNTGQQVTLHATPAPGWGFKQWMGELNPSGATATTIMNSSKTVTAVFAQSTLHVNKEGEGTVSVSPPGGVQTLPFSETYAYNTLVVAYATPAECRTFIGWAGDIPIGQSEDNPLSISMYSNKSVVAVFSDPGSGETTNWTGTQEWDSLGYAGDKFSHKILAPCISVGDQVVETITYVSDTMGGLTEVEKSQLSASGGHAWSVLAGKWRSSDDHHWINYSAYPTIKNHIDTVNATGTLTLKQEMRKSGESAIYATHTLVFQFVRITPNANCDPDYLDFGCHVFVQKSGEHNPTLWPNLPAMPCPPP